MSSPLPSSPVLTPGEYHPPSPGSVQTIDDVRARLIYLYSAVKRISQRFNAVFLGTGEHLSKSGDLDAVYLRVLSPVKPDEAFEVVHGLGRIPVGFDQQPIGKPAIFYAPGTHGAHGWNELTIKLKCNVSNAAALIRVY
jgi:hypothetical protein